MLAKQEYVLSKVCLLLCVFVMRSLETSGSVDEPGPLRSLVMCVQDVRSESGMWCSTRGSMVLDVSWTPPFWSH